MSKSMLFPYAVYRFSVVEGGLIKENEKFG